MAARRKPTRENNLQKVMVRYGALLFLGLTLSIFTHPIEDVGGFLNFLLPAAALYYVALFGYFNRGAFRMSAYIIPACVAGFSLLAIFYRGLSGNL